MNSITIKRSPIVLIRTFVAIEFLGFAGYYLASALGNYKFELYTQLSLTNVLSYPIARLLFLSSAQLAITVYAFLRWYYEAYTIRPGSLIHQWGVFFKKEKNVPLQKTMSVTSISGPLGKRLHYGSIRIENGGRYDSLALDDVSYPQKVLKTIERAINPSEAFNEPPHMESLLSNDEHERLEFKSSLRVDQRTGEVNKDLERATMKTIAAFLNSKGGQLVIGIDDTRAPVGLQQDYESLRRKNSDGFENHFTQIFNTMIGPEFRQFVKLWFHTVEEKDVCVVQVIPSARPAYLTSEDNEHFYVRTGNVTTPLKLSEVESYAKSRWPRRTVSS